MWFLFTAAEQAQKLIVPDSIQKAKFADAVNNLVNMDYELLLTNLITHSIWVVLKVVLALVIYLVGRWLIRRLLKVLTVAIEKRSVDPSLQTFLRNLVKVIFYVILILTIVQILGINTTSIVALLASAGLAIGMALSGTLQNFAGGVIILLLKPYHVGNYISTQGQSGTVEEIMLFSTRISTVDHQTIYIPNSTIATSIINNYSTAKTRRIEWIVSIAYGDDVDVARGAILELLEREERVLRSPKPIVYVAALANSSVNLTVRAWTVNEDYWDVFFAMNEHFYKTLPNKGVHFPFPQMEVHFPKEQNNNLV